MSERDAPFAGDPAVLQLMDVLGRLPHDPVRRIHVAASALALTLATAEVSDPIRVARETCRHTEELATMMRGAFRALGRIDG
jgi:hypothetical protein